MKKVVKLNEDRLRKIISEVTKRTLNEIMDTRTIYGKTWLRDWDELPEIILAERLASPKFEEQLIDRLQDVFENTEVKVKFNCGYNSCDVVSTNEKELFGAIDKVFGRTPRIAEFVKEWAKNKLDNLSYNDFDPEELWSDDDRDPLDYDERWN